MLRRDPTRIELKIDDLEEYNNMKKESLEADSKTKSACSDGTSATPAQDSFDFGLPLRTRTEIIHSRIGYDPKPTPTSSGLPIHR
ncbi:hypothetical protein LOTGIDRAFT_190326 [Lottia gigantea]|uniref:Anaphase-promoting complex subunit CDC26 n=1 Tax=Lottia gigantea TaxID=225164 RepID=V4BUP1_LOTGI|nr:hypothetical protein LOTGIDRAFT_190326 [Lottia gigantea]ESO92824.1 hypothetical protein LOTGIDRAFT_190326 [Lottia gigantea]